MIGGALSPPELLPFHNVRVDLAAQPLRTAGQQLRDPPQTHSPDYHQIHITRSLSVLIHWPMA